MNWPGSVPGRRLHSLATWMRKTMMSLPTLLTKVTTNRLHLNPVYPALAMSWQAGAGVAEGAAVDVAGAGVVSVLSYARWT
jgi:hypothetical protein